jgi:hypothetical protein
MKQKEIKTVGQALNRADVAAGAADQIGAAVGLKHNTGPAIYLDRAGLADKDVLYSAAKQELQVRRAALYSLFLLVFAFVTSARDVLKTFLGNQHSIRWEGTGFRFSLVVPRTIGGLKLILEALIAYFKAHPTRQNNDLNITEGRALQFFDDVKAAELAVQVQKGVVGQLKKERDAAFVTLRNRIRGLFGELVGLLSPLDDRFVTFGFNKPGALSIPGIPANVTAVLVGNNAIAVKWDGAERAERYRVYAEIVGVDAEPVLVGTREDLDFVIEGLPANKTVKIAVSAVNNGGESQRSTVVSVLTLV